MALDSNSDGTVDHIGFAYDVGLNGVYIAQHSDDYIKWNGKWGNSNAKGTYYRVRR